MSSQGCAALVLFALAGCTSTEREAAPATGAVASQGAHPDGPCAELRDGQCLRRDPAFTAARGAAARIDLAQGPVVIPAVANLHAAKVPLRRDQRARIRIEPRGAGPAKVRVRRWSPAPDGWILSDDTLTPAEPAAAWEAEWVAAQDGEALVLVEATPGIDLGVTLSRADQTSDQRKNQ